MKDDDIDLRSVNWEHGMFVTPLHFLRQERYIDSLAIWLLRNCTDSYGLIGGGPRVPSAERGAAKHDPIVDIYDDDDSLRVTVSQCRGLTPGGDLVEIAPSNAISVSVSKGQLEGVRDVGVYITYKPHEKVAEEEFDDEANPQMRSSRRRVFEVKLDVSADEATHSVLLARLSRSEHGLRFERSPSFIPVCSTLSAYSELTLAWRRINEHVTSLAERYTALYRAIAVYITVASGDIETRGDLEVQAFVSKIVAALEDCAYQIMDPLQPPHRFFQQMYRLIRSSAIYLDLSPATVAYFQDLGEKGETEFVSLLEHERQMMAMAREWAMHPDLGQDVERTQSGLQRLQRLEEALEGKYVDFRISPALESLNFVFDKGGNAFYQSVSKPSRPQVSHDELTFVFARLKLEDRAEYRLILMGEPDSRFDTGETLSVQIRINPVTGQAPSPIYEKVPCQIRNQRNFAVDFDAPSDLVAISDLRVIVKATRTMRSAMLYVRRRFRKTLAPERPYRPAPEPVEPPDFEPEPPRDDNKRRVAEPEKRRSRLMD